MDNKEYLFEILKNFQIIGQPVEVTHNKSGLINDTYKVTSDEGNSYILQKINKEVFTEPEKAVGKEIPYKVVPRRQGDIAMSYTDISKARKTLGFEPLYYLDHMCEDSWRWQSNNPNGYEK